MRFFLIAISFCGLSFAQSAQSHMMKARAAICDKNYAAAKTSLDAALASDPNNAEAQLLFVATLCYQKKQPDAKTFASSKTASGTSTLLDAQVALFSRDVSLAKDILNKRLQKGDDYLTRYLLGYSGVLERKTDDALKHLKRAYELNSSHPETLFLLGDLYRAKDQVSDVAIYWSKYLELVLPGNGCSSYVHDYLARAGGR